jgi:hypothetical protein
MNSGIFEMFEEKKIFFKLSLKWDGSGYTRIYEIGGDAENLSAVDVYPEIELCTPIIFLGEASSKISRRKNHFEKFKTQEEHIPEQRSTRTRVSTWNIFGFGRNVYAVEEPF